MGNYKMGPWDRQLDGLMDISSGCVVAHEELEVCLLLNVQMDLQQEAGYELLRTVLKETNDGHIRALVQAALDRLGNAEQLELRIEGHVQCGDAKIVDTRERSLELTPEADTQRRLDSAHARTKVR